MVLSVGYHYGSGKIMDGLVKEILMDGFNDILDTD